MKSFRYDTVNFLRCLWLSLRRNFFMMKRSFVFSLAIVVMLCAVTSVVQAQDFSNFSVNIPSGYTAREDDGMVYISKSGNYTAYMFLVVDTSSSSLSSIARNYYDAFDGYDGIHTGEDGYYYFLYYNDEGIASEMWIDDSSTDSRISSGHYRVFSFSENVTDDEAAVVYASFSQEDGEGGDEESSGCNFGFGVLALCVLGLALKKR